jgi:hypothetical protein
MTSFEFLGYTIVVFPTGKCLIHEGTGTVPPEGKLVGQADTPDSAMTWVEQQEKIG